MNGEQDALAGDENETGMKRFETKSQQRAGHSAAR